ncbi:DUF2188 domain-containing protein [Kribbella sp. NPDC023855]|uniref:DUF2188 domain-containing protein n=1 Tax=Kribbella sp. NPDC023855 TaxID=3154698 RepID=UPI0033E3D3BD
MQDIETFYEDGSWKCRWAGGRRAPFATGPDRERMIEQGSIVARWYGVDHIIRDSDGTVAEKNCYRQPTEVDAS